MGVVAALAVGDALDVELAAEREHPFGIVEVDSRARSTGHGGLLQ